MATTITYKGATLTTFNSGAKTLETAGKYLEGSITITASSDVNNQTKSAIPSETTQTISPDSGYTGLSSVEIAGITSTYVGSGITVRSSSDVADVGGGAVNVPAGYYPSSVSKYLDAGDLGTPSITINVSTGLITATDVINEEGFISSGDSKTGTLQLSTQAATTIVPSESTTTITGQKYMTGNITVAAITSTYVGTGVTTNPTITQSGPTVTVPAGYYDSQQTKTIATRALPTPTIEVGNDGTVAATVTLSTSGYVYSGSETGTTTLPTVAGNSYIPGAATITVGGAGYLMTGTVTVQPIPSQYIVPSGTYTISSVDSTTTFDITDYASVQINLTDADSIAY